MTRHKSRKQSWSLAKTTESGISWSTVLNVAILLLAFFVLLPQIDRFSSSLSALGSASLPLVALAFALGLSTLLFAALTYRLLAGSSVRYSTTLAVQIAGTFTNRLLPAGIGGMGINIRYLMKARFAGGKAASIAAANNLLGFLAHFTLVVLAVLLKGGELQGILSVDVPAKGMIFFAFASALVLAAVWALGSIRLRLIKLLKEAASQLAGYLRRPGLFAAAYLSSMSVTLLYISCFYVCIIAVGLELPPAGALLVFTLGVAAGTITPTPGGLVGVEAGLLSGLIGFGLPEATALSAVLLYRLVTYWLPILPGFIVFKWLQRRGVI